MNIISDSEALAIYRKSLERKAAAKMATELAAAPPEQEKEIRQRINREVDEAFRLHLKKRKRPFGWF